MILLVLLRLSLGYITYDESTFRSFNVINKGFLCFNNYERTQHVHFEDSFINIPKVILIPDLFDIPTQTIDYSLEMLAITKETFTLKIKCSDGILNAIHYRWVAIDDQRIQVISQFNIKDFQDKTFDLENPNTQKYFVSLISVAYIGIVDVEVIVSGITENQVSVRITDSTGNLDNIVSLGYQIVLGTEDMLQHLGQTFTDSQNAFISNKYPSKLQSWFIIPYQGIQSDQVNQLRFKKIYHSDEDFVWYEITAIGCCCFVASKHEPVFLSFISTLEYTPFSFGQVKIKQIVESNTNYIHSFQVQLEGKSDLINALGESKQRIHKGQQLIFLIISVKCSSNEILSFQFQYGSDPNIDSKSFRHKCNGIFKEIIYTVQLVPTIVAYQELIINIAEETCEISQVLRNQKLQKVKLFEIKKTIV